VAEVVDGDRVDRVGAVGQYGTQEPYWPTSPSVCPDVALMRRTLVVASVPTPGTWAPKRGWLLLVYGLSASSEPSSGAEVSTVTSVCAAEWSIQSLVIGFAVGPVPSVRVWVTT
jgi:hypothetical protein